VWNEAKGVSSVIKILQEESDPSKVVIVLCALGYWSVVQCRHLSSQDWGQTLNPSWSSPMVSIEWLKSRSCDGAVRTLSPKKINGMPRSQAALYCLN
jgi:hypothetical protein